VHISFHVCQPWALLLLAALPWVLWEARTLRVLGPWRRRLAIALRLGIFLCLAFALAQIETVKHSDRLSVFFLVDQSYSIPPSESARSLDFIRRATQKMGKNDRAGIIVFAGDASIETSPAPKLDVESFQSVVRRDQTDIAGAIKLAMAAFPRDSQKRIVLLTDGAETQEDAFEEAKVTRSNDVGLDVFPLRPRTGDEVLLESISIPPRVALDEPFEVKIVVQSTRDAPGTLRLFENDRLVASQKLSLRKGKNAFVLPRSLRKPGFYTFEAAVESPADTNPENNRAYGFVSIQGRPKVLFVDSELEEAKYLAAALKAESIDLDLRGPSGLPTSLGEFQSFDSIILSNVSASEVSGWQMKMIESAVRDFGTGLVMIGGEHGFGAGGYLGTPIEKALPVDMDVTHKKVLPRGALVLILHTCEIPNGNAWARDIALAALDVLSRKDMMGVLTYGMGGEQWLFELQEVGDKAALSQLIWGAMPGDMPGFDPTLRMAYEGLQKVSAGIKHIVIISDGDPRQPSQSLATEIAKSKITISTVVIAPHSPRDVDVMKDVAEWGGGNFYDVLDPRHLPQIFIKEATIVKKGLIYEEDFVPKLNSPSEILSGISSEMPPLRGYVTTTAKQKAQVPLLTHHNDPLLAHWRYGLGKAVAFTSDAKSRWATEWLHWSEFKKFWAQLVRWSLREVSRSNFRVHTLVDRGKGRVVVDAIDSEGEFINFLNVKGTVVDPNFERKPINFEQTAPGRYEGDFPVNNVGTYLLNLHYAGERLAGSQVAGTTVSYSVEFRRIGRNERLLRNMAGIAGGRILRADDNVFVHDLAGESAPYALWPALLTAALLLLPLDIAVRRIYIDTAQMREAWASVAARIRRGKPAPVGTTDEVLSRLKGARASVRARTASPATPVTPTLSTPAAEPPGPAVEKPPASAEPEEEPAEASDEPPVSSYTERLLKAKKRAQKNWKGDSS